MKPALIVHSLAMYWLQLQDHATDTSLSTFKEDRDRGAALSTFYIYTIVFSTLVLVPPGLKYLGNRNIDEN